jgi:hypothetical protein
MLPSMAHLTFNTANAMVDATPKRTATDAADLVGEAVHIIHNIDNAKDLKGYIVKLLQYENVVLHNVTTEKMLEEYAPLMYTGTVLVLCKYNLPQSFLNGIYDAAKSAQGPRPVFEAPPVHLVVLARNESGWSVFKYRFGGDLGWTLWNSIAQTRHPKIFENLVELANEQFGAPTTIPIPDQTATRQRQY